MPLPVRDFIIQRLLEFDPSFDVGTGVPTTSLLIDPLSVILQPVIDELSAVQASQSILTILESDEPNSFPEEIVDGLASNVLITRNPGSRTSDVIRLRFFIPQPFTAPKGALIFLGPSGQRYSNSEAVSISSAEVSLNQDGSLYYVDIPIASIEEGSAFNVGVGSITSMEIRPSNVANLSNLFGMTKGRDRETNVELLDRMKVAVTVRALVTGRGIIVTLTENFTTIDEIQPIGFGDPEMMRDIVYNTHIGGNVDVYVKTPGFVSKEADFFGIEVDSSRQKAGASTIVTVTQGTAYPLGRANIDRTNFAPIVKSIDGAVTYLEGALEDYTVNDALGTITRVAGSSIFHASFSAISCAGDGKTISTGNPGEFAGIRSGMVVTIITPSSVAGTYSVKDVGIDEFTIYGTLPTYPVAGTISMYVDDNLSIQYEYNPISVDVIAEARTGREDFSITNTPLMMIESVEVLDPLSGDPTGEVLSPDGGYGAGGYGAGGYGVGAGAGYALVVDEPTLRHSVREDSYIEFDPQYVATSLRVTYLHAASIPAIQAFMDDRNNQSQSASLLARHFIPIYVDATKTIIYDIELADEPTAIAIDEMEDLVKKFIDDIDEGDALEISDLIDLMYDNGAVRVDLETVQSLRGEIHNHDGMIGYTVPESDGSMHVPDEVIEDPTDRPLSPRIARFRSRNILLDRRLV